MAKKKSAPLAVAIPPSPNKQVPFSVKLDGAREVVVTGDFTGWSKEKVRLTPHGPGQWGAQLELPPGEYQYRLIVDGEWRDDPRGTRMVPNPFGGQNSILTVA
jgi:hypothetical protein